MRTVKRTAASEVFVEAPPSKAHTLRALVISALAEGKSTLRNALLGDDQMNVMECLRRLGVRIELAREVIEVQGGGGSFSPVGEELNVGESGVGMNFLTSAACLSDKPVIITGARRITERPIGEVVSGLRQLGCRIEHLDNEGFPPIKVYGGGIGGGTARIHGAKTSQYFSSLVTSCPYADSPVTLECIDEMTEKPYLDISLQMMSEFGVEARNDNYKRISIPRGGYLGRDFTIEGDYSSASFFFLAGAICGIKVTVGGLNPNTRQGDSAFLRLMEKMGCGVEVASGGICVEGRGLSAVEQDMSDIPDLVPPAAIAAAFAKGTSRFANIGHLRLKECDRLAVMASELGKMGVKAGCDEDSLTIEGTAAAHGAEIDPHNDHRIAQSFAVAGLVTGNQKILNETCVAKSFPDFWERFEVFRG
jgi:3-phosphoshikimate 1-carboxyvinyltransferase